MTQVDLGFYLCSVDHCQLVVPVMAFQSPNGVFVCRSGWDTVLDIDSLFLQCSEQMCSLLGGYPSVVISHGLGLAVEYCPGYGPIKLQWFHLVCSDSCIPLTF